MSSEFLHNQLNGRVAQLGERFLRKEEVAGSIPVTSTNLVCSVEKLSGVQ